MDNINNENEVSKELEAKNKISIEDSIPIILDLIRLAQTAAMATIDKNSKNPYISKVGFMSDMQGNPILLLSDLSHHTQNIHKNNAVSLLIDSVKNTTNLNKPRLTICGRLQKTDNKIDINRYLNRHRKAFFAKFADFSFYKMKVDALHFIGGFGTAHTIDFNLISGELYKNSDLISEENGLLKSLNKNHREAVDKMVTENLKISQEGWFFSDFDYEGACFARRGDIVRVKFAPPITNRSEFKAWCQKYGASL